jgi:hypothetical protein
LKFILPSSGLLRGIYGGLKPTFLEVTKRRFAALDSLTVEDGTSPETSVSNYLMSRNNAEDGRIQECTNV